MNKKKIRTALFIFFLSAFSGFSFIWYNSNIAQYRRYFKTEPMGTIWTESKEQELKPILSQNFHYLGRGSTCKAYISQDGRYCLKVFLKSRTTSKMFRNIPFLRNLADLRRELRMKFKRIRGQINAYQFIPKETGMIYYQFVHPRNLFHKTINLTEQDGSLTVLDLDRDEFVIQKKAILSEEYLLNCFANHDILRAKEGISKLLHFTEMLYNQGLVVYCLQFLDNFGFVEDEPIRIDVEHLRYDPSWKRKASQHLKKELANFRAWLAANGTAEVVDHFDQVSSDLKVR